MSSVLKFMRSLLVPPLQEEGQQSKMTSVGGGLSRQGLLDALERQWLESLKMETTKVSMLFHTSFVVYMRQADYDRLADGFQFTVRDAVSLFLAEIKRRMSTYRNYVPHSRYWTFQLVCLPEDALVDGISDDVLSKDVVVIRSTIFGSDDYTSDEAGGGRMVTTVHDVNSMKAMPVAFNFNAVKGLIRLDKDKYQLKFDPDNLLGLGTGVSSPKNTRSVAILTADDGRFIKDGRTFSTYRMQSNQLRISGRNDLGRRGMETVCVDNDIVMNPHVVVTRDDSSGCFSIKAYGPVLLNERRIEPGAPAVELPDNSVILLDGEVQIGFKKDK